MLLQYFLPFLKALHSDNLDAQFQFQQDNAMPHVTTLTQNWLNSLVKTYNLTIFNWSSNSLDFNLIETL